MALKSDSLQAYLQRIGFQGKADASLATLRQLHERHPQAIAFENLTPLMGQPVRLAPEALVDKLVHEGRGGYCLEQNLLLAAVLETLGFRVQHLAARVCWHDPEARDLARTHMLLRVEAEGGNWLLDVGFGGLTPLGPIALVCDQVQTTPRESFMLTRDEQSYLLHARVGERWRAMYLFTLEAQQSADLTVMNWYVATYPESRFVKSLIAARPAPEGRHALENARYTLYRVDGGVEQQQLNSVQALEDVLAKQFAIRLPADSQLQPVLAAALAR